MEPVKLTALPFELVARGPAGSRWAADGTTLEITSGALSDLFVDPVGEPADSYPDVQRLVGEVDGPFQLSARVSADFHDRFDAGVLLVHVDDTTWLKLCFEFSPAGRGTVVSVVTRGVSDDANAWDVTGSSVFLRISRTGRAFALHSSDDGQVWQLVRVCSLGVPANRPVRVGFLSQSPTGAGCRAVFEDIEFSTRELGDTRDGS